MNLGDAMDKTRFENLLEMIAILSSRNIVSTQELANRLSVSTRTIQRMRDELIGVGYNIKTYRGPHGGLEMIKSKPFDLVYYTDQDLNYINQGLKMLMTHLESDLEMGLSPLYLSISKLQRDFSKGKKYRIIDSVTSRKLNINHDEYFEVVNKLSIAIEKSLRVEVEYRTSDSQSYKNRVLEPYELIVVNQIMYLGGLNRNYDSRILRVARIRKVEILEEVFSKDLDMYNRNIKNNMGFIIGSPIQLKVKVKDFPYYTEYIWGDNQVIDWIDESTYTLSVTFGNEFDAREFVLIGGKNVEILEPVSFRDKYVEEIVQILDIYKSSS